MRYDGIDRDTLFNATGTCNYATRSALVSAA